MTDLVQLGLYRLIDGFMPVAVDVDPEARDPVDITPAVNVSKITPFRFPNNKRFVCEPVFHLREGMPDILFIKLLPSSRVFDVAGQQFIDRETASTLPQHILLSASFNDFDVARKPVIKTKSAAAMSK